MGDLAVITALTQGCNQRRRQPRALPRHMPRGRSASRYDVGGACCRRERLAVSRGGLVAARTDGLVRLVRRWGHASDLNQGRGLGLLQDILPVHLHQPGLLFLRDLALAGTA